jgi:DNA-binding SARP family transcriptional activator/pimeloyl-ACP methyl ester carboxylesterase
VEFRILGPLEVASDRGQFEVREAKRRALLAVLLVRANQVVAPDVLVEDLWEGRPPDSAAASLQTYVYQLRKTLGLDSLRTRPAGYVLEVEPDQLDALRFEQAVRAVSSAKDASPDWVAARLGEALGWWRGSALADFEGMTWAGPEAARLESLRIGAVEDLIDARLALGEHAAVVPEIESLVGRHPLRERLWAQLMLALYRCDRQADALRAYGRLRRQLGDELGIEPSKDLVSLEEAILLHKPELDWHPPAPSQRGRAQVSTQVPTGDRRTTPRESRPETTGTWAHRWWTRNKRATIATALLLVVIAIASNAVAMLARSTGSRVTVPEPSGYRPVFHVSACPDIFRNGDSSARCGYLVVPENRSRPRGRTIRLGVYRFPARVEHPASEPIVQVGGEFRLTEPPNDIVLRKRSDSIYLSGRGFFGSEPRLTCPEINDAVTRSLARPAQSPQSKTEFLAAAASCRQRWTDQGVQLGDYSTKESAADVRDLAFALDIRRLNLVAGRHTTVDAREIAGRYPGLIRSTLLINVAPPEANRWDGAITNASGALDRYFAECASQSECASAYPDLAGRLRAAYARNEAAPVEFTTADPNNPGAPPITVRLDGGRTMELALYALADPDALPLLAAAIADPQSSQAAVEFGAHYLTFPEDASWGALLSRVCTNEISTVAREGLSVEAAAAPQLGFLVSDPLLDVCETWGTPPRRSHVPSPSETPTLMLQGDLDPFTSPDWAEATVRTFGDARVVQLPHLGNVAVTGNACVTRLRLRFLDEPRRRIDPHACSGEISPIHFTAGPGGRP